MSFQERLKQKMEARVAKIEERKESSSGLAGPGQRVTKSGRVVPVPHYTAAQKIRINRIRPRLQNMSEEDIERQARMMIGIGAGFALIGFFMLIGGLIMFISGLGGFYYPTLIPGIVLFIFGMCFMSGGSIAYSGGMLRYNYVAHELRTGEPAPKQLTAAQIEEIANAFINAP